MGMSAAWALALVVTLATAASENQAPGACAGGNCASEARGSALLQKQKVSDRLVADHNEAADSDDITKDKLEGNDSVGDDGERSFEVAYAAVKTRDGKGGSRKKPRSSRRRRSTRRRRRRRGSTVDYDYYYTEKE